MASKFSHLIGSQSVFCQRVGQNTERVGLGVCAFAFLEDALV